MKTSRLDSRRRSAIIILGLFFVSIGLPLIGGVIQEDRGLSTTEKRVLERLPSWPDNYGDFKDAVAAFERYYNDHFGFREVFIGGYRKVKTLIGDHDIGSTGNNVGAQNTIEGKDGWFFLNRKWDGDPLADYRNIDLYSETGLLRSILLFAARNHWLREQGIAYLFFFAPNKHTIYSEYLPDYIKKVAETSSFDQLRDALARYTDVQFVDLRAPLLEAKDEARPYWPERKEEAALYYKKDSHWNGAGADIAQFEVARRMAGMFPGKIEPFQRNFEDFIMHRFVGDITLIMGGDEKEAYGPTLARGTCTPETRMDYLQRRHVTHCPTATLNAVIFGDSFFPPLKPYFSDYFRRTSYYWEHMQKAKVEQEIRTVKPDIVIEERAERFLPFTPRIGGEQYGTFWRQHWDKWKKTVYSLSSEARQGGFAGEHIEWAHADTPEMRLEALTDDPHFYLPEIDFLPDRLYLARITIAAPQKTRLRLYYSERGGEPGHFPGEKHSRVFQLVEGENTVFIPLLSANLGTRLRLDPGESSGTYQLHALDIKELNWVDLTE